MYFYLEIRNKLYVQQYPKGRLRVQRVDPRDSANIEINMQLASFFTIASRQSELSEKLRWYLGIYTTTLQIL